jgi:predicted GIY-YIG superfamily endonuclease
MFYTYVLRCCDGQLYVGSAVDLRKRLAQHRAVQVDATAHRLPVRLEYYEACRSELKARLRVYDRSMRELKSHRARIATRSVAGGGSNPASRTILFVCPGGN